MARLGHFLGIPNILSRRLPEVPEPLGRWAVTLAAVATLVTVISVPACLVWGGLPFGDDGTFRGTVGGLAPATSIPGGSIVFASSFFSGTPPLADLDSVDLELNEAGMFDYSEYASRASAGINQTRIMAIEGSGRFLVSFTLANGKDADRTVIRSVGVKVESTEPAPAKARVGCTLGGRGGNGHDVASIEGEIDSTAAGLEHPLRVELISGTLVELGPDDLQVFIGLLDISQPAEYSVRLVAHYETSGGQTGTISSGPAVLVVIAREDAELILPAVPTDVPLNCPSSGLIQPG